MLAEDPDATDRPIPVHDLAVAALGPSAAGLGLLAAAVVLAATEPKPVAAREPTIDVLVAAHDLAAGSAVAAGDLRVRAWPIRLVPAATLTPTDDPVGRLLAGAIRAGEAVTDVRLLGPGLVEALGPGLRAVPIRLTDAGVVALLRAGDRIDIYAIGADAGTERSNLVAAYALVLAVPAQQDSVVPEGGSWSSPSGSRPRWTWSRPRTPARSPLR